MHTTQGARTARSGRPAGGHRRGQLGPRERRRLTQLALCAGLFLVVLLGRGISPDGVTPVGQRLLTILRADMDFAGAFSAVGQSLSEGTQVSDSLGQFVVDVFGAGQTIKADQTVSDGPAARAALAALHTLPTQQMILEQLGGLPEQTSEQSVQQTSGQTAQQADSEAAPTAVPQSTPQVPPYDGPALPEGTTMDYVPLGLSDTVTPVMGVLTSPFGYRDHPVNGEYLFHYGTDLAADTGTPIQAFAGGEVEYIGESEEYGLYIQVDHGNGVKSFYCHCSALYAQKGDQVVKGQTIAAVGDTGNTTGPHLHLELKCDGVHVNPIYYIETVQG